MVPGVDVTIEIRMAGAPWSSNHQRLAQLLWSNWSNVSLKTFKHHFSKACKYNFFMHINYIAVQLLREALS